MRKYSYIFTLLVVLVVSGCSQTTNSPTTTTQNTTIDQQIKTDDKTESVQNTASNTATTGTNQATGTVTNPTQNTDKTTTVSSSTPTKTENNTTEVKIDNPPTTKAETPTTNQPTAPMQISSPAFVAGGIIPSEYTCKASDYNPQLNITNVALEDVKSLALIMDDPDAPNGTWVHWVMYNIDPKTTVISKNSVPSGAQQGLNSWGTVKYGGPCPPSGTHRYYFKVYALDTTLSLSNPTKVQLEAVMNGHIIDQAELIGKFSK